MVLKTLVRKRWLDLKMELEISKIRKLKYTLNNNFLKQFLIKNLVP